MTSMARPLLVAGALTIIAATSAAATRPLPPPPEYHAVDETGVIDEATLRGLRAVLYEHERATSEQIVVAVFNGLKGESLKEWTSLVFQEWKVGKKEKDNGALLAVFQDDRRAYIASGYALESLLHEAKTTSLVEERLLPSLKDGDPSRAVTQATLELLRTLESPLIRNGRAEAILRSVAPRNVWLTSSSGAEERISPIWLFLGLAAAALVLWRVLGGEAHFTAEGWVRVRPALGRKGQRSSFSGGGGACGAW